MENEVKNWLSLSKKEQKIRWERMYKILRSVSKQQLIILEESRQFNTGITGYFYISAIVNSFWNDADFALFLGKNKYSSYAIYPARTVMEKLLKILWLLGQNKTDQDLIAKKELLRRCKESYMREKSKNRSTIDFEIQYNSMNDIELPKIDIVKIHELKAFPSYEELCNKSSLSDASTLYSSYRNLSGLPHGGLLDIVIQKEDKNFGYLVAMSNIVKFCFEMLKAIDIYIKKRTSKEISNAVKKCSNVKLGVK